MGRCITVAIAGLGSRGRDTYAKAAKILVPNPMLASGRDFMSTSLKMLEKSFIR